jgi:hypothetical protein
MVYAKLGLNRMKTPAAQRGVVVLDLRPQMVARDTFRKASLVRRYENEYALVVWEACTARVGIVYCSVPGKVYHNTLKHRIFEVKTLSQMSTESQSTA